MSEGFRRKTFVEIVEDMEAKAREVFGDKINLEDSSPLGMYIKSIAHELSIAWDEMERSHYAHYAQWATGQDLDNIVENFGRKRFEGTKTTLDLAFEGEAGTRIPVGFRATTKTGLVFETLEETTIGEEGVTTRAQAVEIGTRYNVPIGVVDEIVNPLANVLEVSNTSEGVNGGGIETDDNLRERHLEALREPTTGDNVAQYKQWAKEVAGVGNLKVLPTTPSEGFVTLVLADSNGGVASEELVSEVEGYVDSVRPVNAGVVIESATEKEVVVDLSIQLVDGFNLGDVRDVATDIIEAYFKEVALIDNYVSYAQVGKLLLDVEGIQDYENLTLNATLGNVALDTRELPKLSSLDLEVI